MKKSKVSKKTEQNISKLAGLAVINLSNETLEKLKDYRFAQTVYAALSHNVWSHKGAGISKLSFSMGAASKLITRIITADPAGFTTNNRLKNYVVLRNALTGVDKENRPLYRSGRFSRWGLTPEKTITPEAKSVLREIGFS